VPEAPPTFAITTVWPMCFCSSGAKGRKMLSVSPPAAQGTIIRIGRSGYAAWAAADASPSSITTTSFLIVSSSNERP
jgi:hypothetical protein